MGESETPTADLLTQSAAELSALQMPELRKLVPAYIYVPAYGAHAVQHARARGCPSGAEAVL